MEGSRSKLGFKLEKEKYKYCKCKSHIVRACEMKSNESKLIDLVVPQVKSEDQLEK